MQANNDLYQFLTNRNFTRVGLEKSATGHFELEISINGNPLLMLLDTGASKTVLHNLLAESLNLVNESSTNCGGGLGVVNAAVGLSNVEELKIGNIKLHNFPLHIMDLSHPINAIETKGGRKISGVIGTDILEPHSAVIDYATRTLYLHE